MDIALNCDTDQNDILSDEEIEQLMKKLEGIHGIDVREQKVRQMVADHGRNVFCKSSPYCFFCAVMFSNLRIRILHYSSHEHCQEYAE